MNRQTLLKSTLTIFCPFLLLGISQNLSDDFTVLALDTVKTEDLLKNLSPLAK